MRQRSILNKVENRHPVAHGREQVGPIWAEDQIAPAIDSSEEIGELDARSVSVGHWRVTLGNAHLEIRLHFQSIAMFLVSVLRRKVPNFSEPFKLIVGPFLSSRYRGAWQTGMLGGRDPC